MHADPDSLLFDLTREVARSSPGAGRAVRLGAAILVDVVLYPFVMPWQVMVDCIDRPVAALDLECLKERLRGAQAGLAENLRHHACLLGIIGRPTAS